MAIAIKSPLPAEATKVTGDALEGALADLVDLALVAKQAHWNLVGRNFRSVHLQLDEVVTAARTFTDTVAERAVAIGVNPDGRAKTVAAESGLSEFPAGMVQDTDVIGYFIKTYGTVITRMRQRIDATADPDPVTQDLFIGITAELEKEYWMFQAEQ
jgi:starvation-inducible DNA-binding protein